MYCGTISPIWLALPAVRLEEEMDLAITSTAGIQQVSANVCQPHIFKATLNKQHFSQPIIIIYATLLPRRLLLHVTKDEQRRFSTSTRNISLLLTEPSLYSRLLLQGKRQQKFFVWISVRCWLYCVCCAVLLPVWKSPAHLQVNTINQNVTTTS